MLIIRVTGGLGNQMFQYIYGQALKERFNKKVLYDLTWYNMDSSHRYRELENHESYRLRAFGIEPEMISENTSNFFNSKLGKVYNLIQQQWFKWGLRPIMPTYFLGYWNGEPYFENIKESVTNIYELPTLTNENALKYKAMMESGPTSVSMHIRRGDYKNHAHLQVCTPEYYKAAMKHLNTKLDDFCVFVFSDDISYCKEILGEHENVVFIENCGTDLDEFQLMTHCKHHVVSNSTFSWWTAWLAENRYKDGRMVLTPPNWYKNPENFTQQLRFIDLDKIIPDRWTKISF